MIFTAPVVVVISNLMLCFDFKCEINLLFFHLFYFPFIKVFLNPIYVHNYDIKM